MPADAGTWSDGSREMWCLRRLSDGQAVNITDTQSAPWSGQRSDRTIAMVPGVIAVTHSMSRGRDVGLTIYVHPDDAAKLLPAPVDLTDHERIVLRATRAYKASYGGVDRYTMAWRDAQGKLFPTKAGWAGQGVADREGLARQARGADRRRAQRHREDVMREVTFNEWCEFSLDERAGHISPSRTRTRWRAGA
jgi:hypothetical protein